MAVSIEASSLNAKLIQDIKSDLIHVAKKNLHNKKDKTIECYTEITEESKNGKKKLKTLVVPLIYAYKKFNFPLSDPEKIEFNRLPPQFRPGQEEVFNEALVHLKKSRSVYLQLHCGWGKTWCGLNIIAKMGLRTLVIYHRKFLGEQWFNEAQNVVPGQVTIIKDNNVNLETPGNVFLCTVDRANLLPAEFRKTIKFLIVDEAKYFCTRTRVDAMLKYRPYYTMGLCAERTRSDGMHSMLDQFWGPIIFRKSVKPFIVWKYKTTIKPNKVRPSWGQARVDWNEIIRSLAEHEERNQKIRDIVRLFGDGKILVLCKRVKHVETLTKMLRDVGEDVQTLYGNAKGFKNCRVLIATYSKAEIGFDDKNLCTDFDGERLSWLILAADKKEIEQSVGRVMRSESPKVIHIVDDMSTLENHWRLCSKWYRSRNGKIQPVEYI